MAEITVTAANVDTPNHFESIRGTLGAAVAPGDWVYLDGNNGWKPAIGTSAAAAHARGMVVSDGFGSTSFAAGQVVDIVTRGKVSGFSGMTPGGAVYVSPDTAGRGDQSAPTIGEYLCYGGYAVEAGVIYVNPQIQIPAQVA